MSASIGRFFRSSRNVSSDVAQGSVIGPVLFLVHVNYLADGLTSKHGAFADDYKIYLHYSRNGVQDGMLNLQRNLDRLTAVANSWNLCLSNSKCVIMRFSRHFPGFDSLDGDFQYKMSNSVLEVVKCHRDLTVKVNRDLNFHHHVSDLVCKAAGLSRSLLRATVNSNPKFMIAFFVMQIRPILDYCSIV